MKPKLTLPLVGHVYQMLNKITPTSDNCGHLCQSACCQDDTSELGIYLLPGEEQFFSGKEDWLQWQMHRVEDYDFPATWKGSVYFVRCTGSCPRDFRPLQCRTYPLAPHLDNSYLHLVHETLPLPYTCPLITAKRPLTHDFILAVTEVWQLLLTNKLVRDLIQWDSQWRSQNKIALTIVKAVRVDYSPLKAGISRN